MIQDFLRDFRNEGENLELVHFLVHPGQRGVMEGETEGGTVDDVAVRWSVESFRSLVHPASVLHFLNANDERG